MQFNSKTAYYCRYKMSMKRIKTKWCFNIHVLLQRRDDLMLSALEIRIERSGVEPWS